jgi:6-phosphofructokinase 1
MKRIAVLTSGGDCSGMNAAVRAVVRTALSADVEVLGVKKGFSGLIEGHLEPLSTQSVSGIIQRGGTFLQSARCMEMYQEEGQKRAIENLLDRQVDGLVVIGGEGSLKGALAMQRRGMAVMGIPASIDNDIPFTDMSLGVDTALNNIIHAVDSIKDTASSHDRAFVVETMGRNCGYLAVVSSIACGAEFALIPETPTEIGDICSSLRRRFEEGRSNSIIMVAEGAGKAQEIAEKIKDSVGFETRIMVLGHFQRGGSPSVFDRLLGSRFGRGAATALMEGVSGKMVGLNSTDLRMTNLEEVAAAGIRPIDDRLLKLATILRG